MLTSCSSSIKFSKDCGVVPLEGEGSNKVSREPLKHPWGETISGSLSESKIILVAESMGEATTENLVKPPI